MSILDQTSYPQDIKHLTLQELQTLADEVRSATIKAVSQTGGHLGAGLGVIELTVALHYVFNTPEDKLIWDVGHQSYPHKILTGRNPQIHTIRQAGGLSGFTKRSESPYDPFGAGHSSTSVSAALGMATARDLANDDYEVIAVIGDGAMSAGMAYEAMNNAGSEHRRLIVILNDNEMSIAPPVGAMSHYLSRLISSRPYLTLRNMAKSMVSHLPKQISDAAKKTEQYAKNIASGGNLFEEMGFYYLGPIDGHNLDHLLPVLKNIRDDKQINRPILLHVITEKGHGCQLADPQKEKLHAVSKFNIVTGKQEKPEPKAPSYTKVFAEELIKQAHKDDKIVAITAAMPSGTGLDRFANHFPDRMFDVGIAEQHAVTFAAGLATEGYKPFVAIYSTFLQRAYDQIVHDVAIQKLPVRFAIDRCGLVGADGPTHAGSFDIAFLANLPHFVVMAPADEAELCHMIATANQINDRPCAFRYPRGEGVGVTLPEEASPIPIGKGRIIKQGNTIALLSLGTRLNECLVAAQELQKRGLSTTVVDARFAKPLDTDLIRTLAAEHSVLITVEEGTIGGFGSHVSQFLTQEDLLHKLTLRCLTLPDRFIDHGNANAMYEEAGLNHKNIIEQALQALDIPNTASPALSTI